MKPSATDISLKYLSGLSEAVRKKNAGKYGKKPPMEEAPPEAMGESPELGEEELAALLEGGELGDEGDVGLEGAPAEGMEGEEEPSGLPFKKKPLPPLR